MTTRSKTWPRGDTAERSTKRDSGSKVVEYSSRKVPSAARLFSTSWAGKRGSGKRTDSWMLFQEVFASPVVSHSP